MNYNWVQIGERIKQERKKAGLSQSELMQKIGRSAESRQLLTKWEKGTSKLELPDLLNLCKVFDCELGYLLCEYNFKTREVTNIQEATGLSEKAIERLMMYRKYKKALDFFDYGGNDETLEYKQLKEEYKSIKNMIDNHFSAVRKNTNILKIINILLENEESFSVLENISLYLLSEFSLSNAEKSLILQNIESDTRKDYLENYISVYNKVTEERQDIKYSDISDTYLLKFQAQLSKLKDSILKERKTNK